MSDRVQLIAALIAFGLGVVLRHVPTFPKTAAQSLHAFVIWVALPALILARVPNLRIGAEVVWLGVMPWCLLAMSAALVWATARLLGWSREVTGALLLLVPLANTSFLGLPLIAAHLGASAVAGALVWDQLGSFLALSTWGALVLARFSGGPAEAQGPTPTPRELARRVLRFPPFIALLVAFALRALDISNSEISGACDRIGAALVPAVMVAIGLQWRATLPRALAGPFAFALGVRLVVVPALALALATGLALPADLRGIAVLEAGMGPMITAGALALQAQLAPALTASVLGWGTLLSLATTALWAALL